MPLLEVDFWEMAKSSEPIPLAVMGCLILFSVLSWTVILSKVSGFSRAKRRNLKFLRMFRTTPRLENVAAQVSELRPSPLVGVFDFGFSEVSRQMSARRAITNLPALERTLQLGISEEVNRL